jgi:DNA gyrase subunit A
VFKGRDSMGVRGIALAEGDSVISLAILKAFDASPAERLAYLKQRRAGAEGEAEEAGEAGEAEAEAENGAEANGATLESEQFEAMQAAEQVILTISENGYGKRTSSFEYRVTGRGGKGIVAMAVNARNGALVASFPVEESDELMLVTDGGQLIRVPVTGIRIAGRSTQGVIVFDTADEEHVVSVDRIGETGAEAGGEEEAE